LISVKVSKIKKVRAKYGVSEYRFGNGLCVLYKRVTAAPVVAVCVTFHVGSRNEARGHTGSTHILEHLLFKDSKKFNRENGKAITDYLEWFGAYLNATTWLDRTNYFELLPRERLPEALELEADRMRGSLFNDADLASEMTVVRNEYERSRNNPFELLDEKMMAAAFTRHPYRIPTIGTKEDIEGSTARKLREFYDVFYWPNNATLSVMGDVSWLDVEKLVLKYFAPIPASPHAIPTMNTIEPPQTEAHSVIIEKPLGVSIASLMYKIPAATHADFPALLVLTELLGGGFSSRLQQTLVDRGFAADISVSMPPLHDPGVLSLTAHCTGKLPPQKLCDEMRREVEKLASKAPSTSELKYAGEGILSRIARENDGVFSEIRAQSESIAAGDWTLGYQMEKAIQAVRPADIARTAKKYLQSSQETSGVLLDTTNNSKPSASWRT